MLLCLFFASGGDICHHHQRLAVCCWPFRLCCQQLCWWRLGHGTWSVIGSLARHIGPGGVLGGLLQPQGSSTWYTGKSLLLSAIMLLGLTVHARFFLDMDLYCPRLQHLRCMKWVVVWTMCQSLHVYWTNIKFPIDNSNHNNMHLHATCLSGNAA